MPAAAHLAVGYARSHLSVATNELRPVQYDFLHDLFVKRQLVDKAACHTHTTAAQQQQQQQRTSNSNINSSNNSPALALSAASAAA